MLQLELSFEKLVDSALHLEAVEMEHSDDGGVGPPTPPRRDFLLASLVLFQLRRRRRKLSVLVLSHRFSLRVSLSLVEHVPRGSVSTAVLQII